MTVILVLTRIAKTGFGIIRIDRNNRSMCPVAPFGYLSKSHQCPLEAYLNRSKSSTPIVQQSLPSRACLWRKAQTLRSSWAMPVVPRWSPASSMSSRFSNMRRARLNNQSNGRCEQAAGAAHGNATAGLVRWPAEDAADGLAAALCHCHAEELSEHWRPKASKQGV